MPVKSLYIPYLRIRDGSEDGSDECERTSPIDTILLMVDISLGRVQQALDSGRCLNRSRARERGG